jgi:pimeloyl-ACP methyl ester carboxylesterase
MSRRASALVGRRRLLLATVALVPACTPWVRPAPGPMELLHFDDTGPYAAPTLVVMLPGAYSTPQEFVDEGFVQALRQRKLHADVVIAGARIEHYIEGPVLERLHDQVIGPARARGVQRVWLVGISLGGLFAMAYAARHPDQVTGVLALAPYLGRRTLLADIIQAGGPEAWAARRQPQADDLLEHEVWAWLAKRPVEPALHLGYGRDDRFVDAHRLLAARLPADRVFDVPGGHDWRPWSALWAHWLDQGLIPGHAAGPT